LALINLGNFMETKDTLNWTVQPCKESWLRTLLVIIFVLIIVGIVGVSFQDLMLVIVTIGVLGISLLRFFFPTTYELTSEGITIKYLGSEKKHSWKEYQCFYLCPQGIQLSTMPKPGRLDSFRGVYLIYGSQDRNALHDYLGKYINEAR